MTQNSRLGPLHTQCNLLASEQIINDTTEHGSAPFLCQLRQTGLRRGVEGQLLSQSDLLQPGIQSQHSNQPTVVSMKTESESERKQKAVERIWQWKGFLFPLKIYGFTNWAFPTEEADLHRFINVGRHQLPLIKQMMVWWAENKGGN